MRKYSDVEIKIITLDEDIITESASIDLGDNETPVAPPPPGIFG